MDRCKRRSHRLCRSVFRFKGRHREASTREQQQRQFRQLDGHISINGLNPKKKQSSLTRSISMKS